MLSTTVVAYATQKFAPTSGPWNPDGCKQGGVF